jgi:hypothetical protein
VAKPTRRVANLRWGGVDLAALLAELGHRAWAIAPDSVDPLAAWRPVPARPRSRGQSARRHVRVTVA